MNTGTFYRTLATSLLTCMLLLNVTSALADEVFSRYEIKNLLRSKIDAIQALSQHPVILKAAKERHLQQLALSDIQRIDQAWASYPDSHPEKTKMFNSKAGRLLKDHVEFQNSIFNEIFLTDSQGANITCWPITSDFWQGDEAKWYRSFNHGKGDIFISNLAFDESSHSNAIQISVPVMENDKAIGVLIAGIKLSYLQAKYLYTRHQHDHSHEDHAHKQTAQ